MACVVYGKAHFSDKGKKVIFRNPKRHPDRRVSGRSILDLLTLEACKGDILEIMIEGTDEAAKELREDIKRGLSNEGYLYNKYHKEFREIEEKESHLFF